MSTRYYVVKAAIHTSAGDCARQYRCKTRGEADRWMSELYEYACVQFVSVEERYQP